MPFLPSEEAYQLSINSTTWNVFRHHKWRYYTNDFYPHLYESELSSSQESLSSGLGLPILEFCSTFVTHI